MLTHTVLIQMCTNPQKQSQLAHIREIRLYLCHHFTPLTHPVLFMKLLREKCQTDGGGAHARETCAQTHTHMQRGITLWLLV